MKANEYVDRLRKRIKDLEQKVDQLSGDYERWSENEIARLRAEVEELRKNQLKPGEVRAEWTPCIESHYGPYNENADGFPCAACCGDLKVLVEVKR